MSQSDATVLNQRYELQRRVGRGGMADVFLARDQLLDRPVALKVLFPEFAQDPAFVERFRREAQAAANLNHPNIVSVYDWGEAAGTYYIVMEYIDGRSLAEVLRTEGRIRPDRAIDASIADRPRARLGAHERRGAPRHQAGEHPHHSRRPGEGRRLRHRTGAQHRARARPHAGRLGDGHRELLLARAGAGSRTRSRAATSTRSASCSTRCSPASRRSPARTRSRSRTSRCTSNPCRRARSCPRRRPASRASRSSCSRRTRTTATRTAGDLITDLRRVRAGKPPLGAMASRGHHRGEQADRRRRRGRRRSGRGRGGGRRRGDAIGRPRGVSADAD